MVLTSGSRLGPYEIVSLIGVGGMGEVYRARDTRLDRSVAVKLVSPELADNPQKKMRFDREARSISRLNHPNICTLFDVGEENGTSYLVMELLEGETLGDRIGRGPLPLADVIRYGIQIASALDRAHCAGIVHRDLKPGNVMITSSGAKLLDFGLAKMSEPEPANAADAATLQRDLTEKGTILGTFRYMAPEQLEGAEADARTDIFALGAVLYEMITGRRAFEGKTRTSLIAAIVSGNPAPIRTTQPLAPPALDHVVSTCLEKDPERRWQSARDVANELGWIAETPAVEPLPPRRHRRAWPVAAALLALSASAMTFAYVRERIRPATPVAFSMIPPRGCVFDAAPVIAPNGRAIAYATRDENGQRALWIRRIGDVTPTKLATGERYAGLFWSPDGKWIAYFGGPLFGTGVLMRISADGAQPEVITKFDGFGFGGAWGAGGDIVFSPRDQSGLYRVAATGSEPVAVTTIDAARRETVHGYPMFLSDRDQFLYVVRTTAEAPNEIHAGSLRGGVPKLITKADSLVGLWNGWLLVVRDGAMYAQRFDEKKLALTGEPRRIIDDVRYSEDFVTSFASVANDGAVMYRPASAAFVNFELGWYDDAGRLLEKLFSVNAAINQDVGASNPAREESIELSPDDSKIAMVLPDPRTGAANIYTRDLARGVVTRLAGGPANNSYTCWSPDGRRLFYSSDRDGMYDIYSQSDDGLAPAQVIWKGGNDKRPMAVSPDGATLLARRPAPKTKLDLWIVPLNGGPPRPWIATEGRDDDARFSPDGRWVVYMSDHSGRAETYVKAFPDGQSYQVSTEGGVEADWDHDGSRVFFRNGSTLYAVDVKRDGQTATIGKPAELFIMPKTMNGWWRSKTKGRFLCRTLVDPRETVSVANYVKGWVDALK